jgi:predicted nuclease of predicted toxin-antitoxin system
MKLLIDECLSPELTKLAYAAGYGESSHVVWMGLAGRKDWELKTVILDGNWTFVTKNSVDFRGPPSRPGSKGQYADVAIHAGLITSREKKHSSGLASDPRRSGHHDSRVSDSLRELVLGLP